LFVRPPIVFTPPLGVSLVVAAFLPPAVLLLELALVEPPFIESVAVVPALPTLPPDTVPSPPRAMLLLATAEPPEVVLVLMPSPPPAALTDWLPGAPLTALESWLLLALHPAMVNRVVTRRA
jgi:hypothetical protein